MSLRFNFMGLNEGRVLKCRKCTNGKRPNGKVCKYCNGTGTVTKPNQ
jgi:hypothetical protein